jgi:hypothetical protein
MKKLIYIVIALFFSQHIHAANPSLNNITNAEFKEALNRIIITVRNSKFEALKGEKLPSVVKGSNIIEKWNALDSLPGQQNGIISKSFCTSFRAVFSESADLNAEFLNEFNTVSRIIEESIPTSWWQTKKESKEDGTQRLSISRKAYSEIGQYPDLNLEVVKRDGKYMIQLSISL